MQSLAFSALLLVSFASAAVTDEGPNAFTMVRVVSPQVSSQLKPIRSSLLARNESFFPYIQEASRLHLTIDDYKLDDSQTDSVRNAMRILRQVACHFWPEQLTFTGLERFVDERQVVLYGKLDKASEEFMTMLHVAAKNLFDSFGIHSVNEFEYRPQMTIAEFPASQPELYNIAKSLNLSKFKLTASTKIQSIFFCGKSRGGRLCGVISKQNVVKCHHDSAIDLTTAKRRVKRN